VLSEDVSLDYNPEKDVMWEPDKQSNQIASPTID